MKNFRFSHLVGATIIGLSVVLAALIILIATGVIKVTESGSVAAAIFLIFS